jgi:formylglycine-generating enzyme required for sulfatase activity
MPSLQKWLECLAQAVIDHAVPQLEGRLELGASLHSIVRNMLVRLEKSLPRELHRGALQDCLTIPSHTLALKIDDAIQNLIPEPAETYREALVQYLTRVPDTIRRALRRPGDIDGSYLPEAMPLSDPEDWLIFLPDRVPRFRDEEVPELIDNWKLQTYRGYGNGCEAWFAEDNAPGVEFPTGFLKFITDWKLRENFDRHEDYFVRILDLDPIPSIVPLRSVYLLTDPPCLEYPYFIGYDLAGVMNDWRWRGTPTRPDQVLLVLRRLSRAMAKLHRLDPPVVHGALRPSNVLAHPDEDGKVTLLISDLGWGLLSSLGANLNLDPAASTRQSRRGALQSLYFSPQVLDGAMFTPQDDVYALGMIWYQLLQRDPTAPPPVDNSWAMEFRDLGLTDGQARLIAACLSPKLEYRPRDAVELSSYIESNMHLGLVMEGSKTFQLAGTSRQHTALKVPDELPEDSQDELPAEEPRTPSKTTSVEQVRQASLIQLPPRFKNSVGMSFVLIPAGTFLMGSPEGERGRQPWEGPQHSVTLRSPFYFGITSVTQGQYQQVMGKNPSSFTKLHGGGPDFPVEQVSWDEANDFCDRLSKLPAEAGAFRFYRLPTEAEWEYACRADTQTPFAFGTLLQPRHAHFLGQDPASWKKEFQLAGKTCKVGTFPPNLWNLHDTHGNVQEWCRDFWSEDYYLESPPEDPPGPEDGNQRVVRGGSFSQFASECRSASRMGRPANTRLNTIGFRVMMVVQS